MWSERQLALWGHCICVCVCVSSVCNKWFHERGQEFIRPCDTSFDNWHWHAESSRDWTAVSLHLATLLTLLSACVLTLDCDSAVKHSKISLFCVNAKRTRLKRNAQCSELARRHSEICSEHVSIMTQWTRAYGDIGWFPPIFALCLIFVLVCRRILHTALPD